jgi:hypothetical protein
VDWANHEPCLAAIAGNAAIRRRFTPAAWSRIERAMRASSLWECGRVNFTMRRFGPARGMMLAALRMEPTPKRLAMFTAAAIQRRTDRALFSRLRFRDADLAANAAT